MKQPKHELIEIMKSGNTVMICGFTLVFQKKRITGGFGWKISIDAETNDANVFTPDVYKDLSKGIYEYVENEIRRMGEKHVQSSGQNVHL